MLIQDFLLALAGYATSPMLLALIFGSVVLGVVMGALPGISSTMALAILLPVTFGMEPHWAISVLLGVLVGSVYGGSISAILLNIPGTPGAIVTQFDGHPMARAGRAGEAMSLALLASTLGGLVGLVALALIAPTLAKFAMNFRSPEFCLLAVLGLVLLAFTSGAAMLAGLLSGAIGVLCGLVGFDVITGIARFDFGAAPLQNGIDMVPVTIGIFGLAEVLKTIAAPGGIALPVPPPVGRMPMPLGQIARSWKSVARGSFIGMFVGAIPAAGSSIAVALAYAQEQRFARPGARFGKGEPAGIIAPEAANSALTGGSLIPVLTLGIPGDSMSAILIGGLIIHGLRPGPMLFTEHPEVVAGIYVAILLAVVFTLVAGWALLRPIVSLMRVPPRLMVLVIAMLCLVGSFAIRNAITDVVVMIVFGAIGYVFSLFRIPVAPLVFGLILGPLMEENFRRSLMLNRGSASIFVERPMSLAILAVIVAVLVMGLRGRARAGAAVAGG
ncbi:tripartite tricarboxylate transporter permease [Frigidibacter sp. MR17.24]|uniref:tripartite tricarboxylate transporter permease n=1 Tax=Frigidibacter sp. MR17.24 TaxID=3127345 RepID=UPI003012AC65